MQSDLICNPHNIKEWVMSWRDSIMSIAASLYPLNGPNRLRRVRDEGVLDRTRLSKLGVTSENLRINFEVRDSSRS